MRFQDAQTAEIARTVHFFSKASVFLVALNISYVFAKHAPKDHCGVESGLYFAKHAVHQLFGNVLVSVILEISR